MNKQKTENKINKLCLEYSKKILSIKGTLNCMLIDFAREYNNIWKDVENEA